MTRIEIRLLGDVRIVRDGAELARPSRRLRAVLAVLALDAGRTVSVEALADRVWGDDLPARVRGSLQTYVARLRRLLGPAAVSTEAGGYRLDLARDQVDALILEDLTRRARAAPQPEEQRRLLTDALGGWQGEPFGEQLSAWLATTAAPRLIEIYLAGIEQRVDLDLSDGRDVASVVAELRDLLTQHPLRESLWVRLLRTLHQTGRTAEALETYEEIRLRLADELGADPSPDLQEAHRVLLAGGAVPPRPTGGTTPRQLPPDVPLFVGRQDALTRLDELVRDPHGSGRTVVIHGPGGAGKTSLAVHWARRAAADFPDGQLFVNLRGFTSGVPLDPHEALDLLLRGLHVSGTRIPDGTDARSALLRSELADRAMLLVIDDVADADQLRPLLPGGRSMVVVTSRRELRGVVARDGAARLPLMQLPPPEAVELLQRRSGRPATISRDSLEQVAELCGHLPLALAVVAERLGRGHPDDLSAFIDDLADEKGRLDALGIGDDPLTDVRQALGSSYRALPPDAARAFQMLGLHPDSVVSVGAMAALAGVDRDQTAVALDRLAECHLLRRLRTGWFTVHDLVRLYATEVAATQISEVEATAAGARLLSWAIHTAEATCQRLDRRAEICLVDTGPLLPGVQPDDIGTPAQAQAWFEGHRRLVAQLVQRSVDQPDHRAVCRLAYRSVFHLARIGSAMDELEHGRVALDAARHLDDPQLVGAAANHLGIAVAQRGDNERARALFTEAAAAFEVSNDLRGELWARNNLALILRRADGIEAAVPDFEEVLARTQSAQVPGLVRCVVLHNLAECHAGTGRYAEAMAHAREMLDIARAAGHVAYESGALESIGMIHLAAGAPEKAATSLRIATDSHRAAGNRTRELPYLVALGRAELAADRPAAARAAWHRSLRLLEEMGGGNVEVDRETVLDLLDGIDSDDDPQTATAATASPK